MQRAALRPAAGQGEVEGRGGLRAAGFLKSRRARLQRLLKCLAPCVGGLAEGGTLFGGNVAQLLHHSGDEAVAAKVFYASLLYCCGVRCGGRLCQ